MRRAVRPSAPDGDRGHRWSFARALRALAAAPPVPLEALAAEPALGDCLDEFELLAVAGRGGMGVVYRARDRLLDREVAVKVLAPAWGRGRPEALLEREARATARLHHPGIVTIHRIGRHAGRVYLVLELLHGETLAARLARGPIDRPRAIGVALGLCDALGHAHRQGVVHRDVKPGNVFLEGGRVKVFDFGLSGAGPTRAARGSAGGPGAGEWSGTPAYMAPEQWRGEPADPRSDVYAAGVVLYELLAGRPPDGSALAPGAPGPSRLEEIAARAMSPAREDRYADGGEMAAALRRARELSGRAPIRIGARRHQV